MLTALASNGRASAIVGGLQPSKWKILQKQLRRSSDAGRRRRWKHWRCDVEDVGVNKNINPRRFARVKPGGRVSNAAKIVVGPKDPMIDCMLVDFSAGGACLEIAPQTALPPRFELVHGNTKKRCRLVWKAGRRVGVSF